MNAVKFDWLECADVVTIHGNQVEIKLCSTANEDKQYVTGYCEPYSQVEFLETMVDLDPQNAVELPYSVLYVDNLSVFLVDDWDNVHAIQDMPFKLTGHQISSINEQLLEKSERVLV